MPHRCIRQTKKLTLRRDLGLTEATFAGVGIILGAGIYALIGKAAGTAGNAVWISFLLASLVAAFTGLSYAELSSRFPKDSGEYVYAQKAFSKKIGWLIAWLIIFAGIVSAATVALGFAGYFKVLFAGFITVPLVVAAIVLIAVFSFVNFYGIRETAKLNIIFTILEIGGLIAIIIFSIRFIGTRSIDYMEMANGWPGVFSAAALIFFAFIGFESIIKLSEETRNARKIIPKALILSIAISTILYILVVLGAITIMGWDELGRSSAPLADVAAIAFGSKAFLILSVIALFSTANTVLLILVTTTRMMYGLGNEYPKIGLFSRIHSARKTPWIAVIAVMATSMLFSLIGDIKLIAEITNFSIFVVFAVVNAALIAIRNKLPCPDNRCFRMPLNIKNFPVLSLFGVVTSLFMLANLSYIAIVGGVIISIIGYAVFFFVK